MSHDPLIEKIKRLIAKAPPELRNRIFFILGVLILANILIWVVTFSFSRAYPFLLGLVSLAYGLGLRHAVDADHIAAIDNTTRKLMHDGKKPVAVGLFFSLGHSTIVIILSALVAFSTAYVSQHLPQFKAIGGLFGTTVSCIFLLAIGILNLIIFIDVYKIWRHVLKGGHFHESHIDHHLHNRGLIARLLRPLLKAVNNSWNMYFVGFLFGLGFDTASEVGLLSISAASTARGLPSWAILLLPLAFTAGMALIDTIDGILMLGAYGWAYIKPVRKLYYNLNITLVSVIIALFIGSVEGLQVLSEQLHINTGIFKLANSLQLDYLGYIIIGAFVVSWIFSMLIYKYRKYDLLDLTDHH